MRAFVAALAGWSIVVLGLLVFEPGFAQAPSCMRLVGRSAECEALAEAWNRALWWQNTLPLIVVIAAGYLAILLVALAGRRRRATRRATGRTWSDHGRGAA
jgi:hypothetical protein